MLTFSVPFIIGLPFSHMSGISCSPEDVNVYTVTPEIKEKHPVTRLFSRQNFVSLVYCVAILRLVNRINPHLKVGRVRQMLRAESTSSQLDSETVVEQERAHLFSFPGTLLTLLSLFSTLNITFFHRQQKRGGNIDSLLKSFNFSSFFFFPFS